jgi:Zn-dependent M28 family amino/carboxypeptidase
LKALVVWILFLAGLTAMLLQFVAGAPGSSFHGAVAGLTEDEMDVSQRLRDHVETLSHTIGDRGSLQTVALDNAADMIVHELKHAGYTAAEQRFQAGGVAMSNITCDVPGTRSSEIVILCAHYDSPPRSSGADDNASGCAALLEIARRLASSVFERTLRFYFFAGSEGALAGTESMGSRVAAKASRDAHERVVAVLSLDTLGYYSEEPGSQSRPFPLTPCYPSQGDFLTFVSDFASRDLMQTCVADFRSSTQLPAEAACLPAWIPGLSSGDHGSYWKEGFKAVLVTDTASLRNPNYGKMGDTYDRLDFRRLTRAVLGLTHVTQTLCAHSAPSN